MEELKTSKGSDLCLASAFLLSVSYLEKLLLAETTLPVSEYRYVESLENTKDITSKGHMVIDAQAIEHLELLEIPGKKKDYLDGSLLSYVTRHNVTSFGKRLMKKWLVMPLRDCEKISLRQDAVEDLVKNEKLLN